MIQKILSLDQTSTPSRISPSWVILLCNVSATEKRKEYELIKICIVVNMERAFFANKMKRLLSTRTTKYHKGKKEKKQTKGEPVSVECLSRNYTD